MYALSALGLVAVYRGSGVVNFASGAMGMLGAYAYWILTTQHGWPVAIALLVGVAVSGGVGLLSYLVIMRPLRQSSNLVQVVATLGLLVTIEAGIALAYSDPEMVSPFLPHASVTVAGAAVGMDRLVLTGLAIVITVGATLLYGRTRFGLATSATAENPIVTSVTGWSPGALAAFNWAIGGCLSGIAGICLAPITGLSTNLATLLLLPCLAAAVVGGMRSFVVAAIAGLVIGALQSVLSLYVGAPGVADAVPFVVILAIMMFRGRVLPSREMLGDRFPRVSTGRVPIVLTSVAVVVAAVVLAGQLPLVWVSAVTLSFGVALILLSLVVVTGYAGQLSLAQYSIAAVAGLVAAQLSANGFPFLVAGLCAIAASVPIGFLVGLPAVRTRGPSLAIATLALSVVLIEVVLGQTNWSGGPDGFALQSPELFGFDIDPISFPERYALVSLVCVIACGLMVANLRRARAGRRMLAVRANERAATALGIDVRSTKLAAFCTAASIAAVGGVLLTFRQPFAMFNGYAVLDSIMGVSYSVIGGIGYVSGALIGSTMAPGAVGGQALSYLGTDYASWLAFASGILLLVVVVRFPDGAAPYHVDGARSALQFVKARLPYLRRQKLAATSVATTPVNGQARSRHEDRLEIRGLSVRFGKVVAVNDISFELKSGEIIGLVGANGAGKTTLIDAVTGFVPIADGQILLNGEDLSRMRPSRRARSGLSRSFQSLELFEDLTVEENILAGCDDGGNRYWLTDLVKPRRLRLLPDTVEIIHQLNLENVMHQLPSELTLGQRRLVAIARAMARQPGILLLDEPAAGLDIAERRELGETVRQIVNKRNTAVILVEHDLDLVRAVADRVVVMEFGRCIASGHPERALQESAVVASYVGASDVAEVER